MKHWINKNYKTLIIAAFLIPIITVAIVSISHVTKWYGISNPVTWSVYLSIGVEIAALSALAAISANMGKKVYFPFAIVTLVQFIGNIFFAYSYIQIGSESFRQWVELVSPLLEYMGVEPTDFVGHKRFLAFFAGGMLPIISLSFLHMLVKFTEEDRLKEIVEDKPKEQEPPIDPSEFARVHLSEADLKVLEEALLKPQPPNENLVKAFERYEEQKREEEKMKAASLKEQWALDDEEILRRADEIEKRRNSFNIETKVEETPKSIFPEEVEYPEEYNRPVYPTQEERKQILVDMMQRDEELGLYDSYWEGVSNEEPPTNNEITPALSDEEVREMFMDEWERKFDLVEEEPIERNFFVDDEMQVHEIPTIEEQNQNFNSFVVPVVQEPQISEEETFAIQTAIENETVPEPFATPEEVQRFNLDAELINQTLEEANRIIDTPEEPQIEVEVSNNWNEPPVQEEQTPSQENEEELKKKV